MLDTNKIRKAISDRPDVHAAFLFGSVVTRGKAINDLDMLILPAENVNRLKIQLELAITLSELTDLPVDGIDIVFFDQDIVDPKVLFNAVNTGVLLKNDAPSKLSKSVENLSKYFLVNESMIRNANRLNKERLEEFCEG